MRSHGGRAEGPSLLPQPIGWAPPRVRKDDAEKKVQGRARRVELNEHGHHRQHFLLRSEAVTLTEAQIARMTDEQAYAAYEAIRFADNGGVPTCSKPACKGHKAYRMTIRRRKKAGVEVQTRYKCSECRATFTLTSGTVLAQRKMSIRDLLYAQMVFVNAVSGEAALRLRRAIGCSYKTAYVLEGKLRESMAKSRPARPLHGVVEVDGTTIGGHARKGVDKKRGLASNVGRRSDECAIVVLRERRPDGLTKVGVFPHEWEYRDGTGDKDFIRDNVVFNSTLVSDEGFELSYVGPHATVNHKQGFRVNGVHNNGAESFFARVKRAENGVHYRLAGHRVLMYAQEMAWREDHRRTPTGEQWRKLARAVSTTPVSTTWAGYWQRWEKHDPTIIRRDRRPLHRARTPLVPV